MNTSTLTVRLKREAKAHPGKSALLALLASVAVYVWAPYVRGWFGGAAVGDRAVVAKSAIVSGGGNPSTAASSAASQETSPAGAKTAPPRPRWDQFAQWMKQDRRRRPVQEIRRGRNPFEPSATHRKLVAEEQAAKQRGAQRDASGQNDSKTASQPVVVTPTPHNSGLSVSSTLVGGRRSLAVMHGPLVVAGQAARQTVVGEGETLLVTPTAAATPVKSSDKKKPGAATASKPTPTAAPDRPRELIPFRVVRITVDAVTLEHAGKRHELRVATAKPSGNVVLKSVATQ